MNKVQRTQIFKGFSSFDNNKAVVYDIDLVNRDLTNHLFTRIGERVMMPTFGCIVWDRIFDPFTDVLRDEIIDNITDILNSDSRVEVESIIADSFEHGIVIDATLRYNPFDVIDTFSMEFDRRTVEPFGNSIVGNNTDNGI